MPPAGFGRWAYNSELLPPSDRPPRVEVLRDGVISPGSPEWSTLAIWHREINAKGQGWLAVNSDSILVEDLGLEGWRLSQGLARPRDVVGAQALGEGPLVENRPQRCQDTGQTECPRGVSGQLRNRGPWFSSLGVDVRYQMRLRTGVRGCDHTGHIFKGRGVQGGGQGSWSGRAQTQAGRDYRQIQLRGSQLRTILQFLETFWGVPMEAGYYWNLVGADRGAHCTPHAQSGVIRPQCHPCTHM